MKTIPLLLILACGGDENEPVRHVWECVEIVEDAPEPAREYFCATDEEGGVATALINSNNRDWTCHPTDDECACESEYVEPGAAGCYAD